MTSIVYTPDPKKAPVVTPGLSNKELAKRVLDGALENLAFAKEDRERIRRDIPDPLGFKTGPAPCRSDLAAADARVAKAQREYDKAFDAFMEVCAPPSEHLPWHHEKSVTGGSASGSPSASRRRARRSFGTPMQTWSATDRENAWVCVRHIERIARHEANPSYNREAPRPVGPMFSPWIVPYRGRMFYGATNGCSLFAVRSDHPIIAPVFEELAEDKLVLNLMGKPDQARSIQKLMDLGLASPGAWVVRQSPSFVTWMGTPLPVHVSPERGDTDKAQIFPGTIAAGWPTDPAATANRKDRGLRVNRALIARTLLPVSYYAREPRVTMSLALDKTGKTADMLVVVDCLASWKTDGDAPGWIAVCAGLPSDKHHVGPIFE